MDLYDSQQEVLIIVNANKEYKEWTTNGTKVLIDLYKNLRRKVGSSEIKRMKVLWEVIAKEMRSKGYDYSAANCENRWKVLERNFKKHVDDQRKTGRGRKNFEFIKKMEELFQSKRNVFPQILLSNKTDVTVSDNKSIERNAIAINAERTCVKQNNICSQTAAAAVEHATEEVLQMENDRIVAQHITSQTCNKTLQENHVNRKRKRVRQSQESKSAVEISNNAKQIQAEKLEYYRVKRQYYEEKSRREEEFVADIKEIKSHLEKIASAIATV